MNPYQTNINLQTKIIIKTPQGQLYLDKSNLFFVPAKRKVLHHIKHTLIQNIIAAKFYIKENNI
jgi:hypothetical protein